MTNPWIVEVFTNGRMTNRRKFTTAERAVSYANDMHDRQSGRDIQIISPTRVIYQTNPNGNTDAKGMK